MQASERAGAILSIDLDAIVSNWHLLRRRVAPSARCVAVVKADAYGLGAARVAPALARAGCTRFAVATLEEALSLRAVVRKAEVFVLNGPLPGTEREFCEANVTPVLNSPEQVRAWVRLAQLQGKGLAAALHVDTGMSRLGLSYAEAVALAGDVVALKCIDIQMVLSHLACADEPAHPMNLKQLTAFESVRALFPGTEGSLAASSGIFLGKDWHADWTRPGAALYGVRPLRNEPNPMKQVVRLQGKIVQTREVAAETTVSYGATHCVHGRRRLATVAIGYADGLFRALSNRTYGYLGRRRIPLVGRVTMDLSIFDVTDVPENLVEAGCLVELIGSQNTVDDVASAAGTIGYEVLTALGKRIHRRYLGGWRAGDLSIGF